MCSKNVVTAASAEIWLLSQDIDLMMETRNILRREFDVVKFFNQWEEIHARASGRQPSILLVDYEGMIHAHEQRGLDEITRLRRQNPAMVTLITFGYGNFPRMMPLIGTVADLWLLKPWDENKLLAALRSALTFAAERFTNLGNLEFVKSFYKVGYTPGPVFSRSATMQELMTKVVNSQYPLLIFGEPATGKNWLAAWIHTHFGRKGLFTLDLSHHSDALQALGKAHLIDGIEKGCLETLVLDQMQSLSPQSLLALDEALKDFTIKYPQIGIIGLWGVLKGRIPPPELTFFAEQSFEIPPLRERKEDIPLLAAWLTEEYCRVNGVETKILPGPVAQSLMRLPWVGNASELAQALRNAIAVSKTDEFDISDFALLVSVRKSKIRRDKNLRIKEKEKQMVITALKKHLGNISRAASELGITRQALYRRIEKHGITGFGVY